MPRPAPELITFTIDGREVQAPGNTMLVDAAKLGDVEIPVFCYEPKLGPPVGACRMCLVEIEGIPKLQTGCSTPVKDGMVVHTQSERVHQAQRAVVEFLLINHPLDCPVCDKGGECPLQDITYGWGPGTSRFIEPKRHFVKPLELSPLVAIDRERCILCYRCVRFSQEVAEDEQLVLDERAMRVIARDNPDVDDGWLCDKGRFGYQAIHSDERITEPLVRDGGTLRAVSWERALTQAAAGLARAGARSGAIAGGQ